MIIAFRTFLCATLLVFLIVPSVAVSGEPGPVMLAQAGAAKSAQQSPFVYKPPSRGKPGNRVGGGSRGVDMDLPVIVAIVPDHTGFTTSDKPNLYWYLSKTTEFPIEFTLTDENRIDPIVETRLQNAGRSGIRTVRLADYNVSLVEGVEYQWFVTIVRDPEQRSKDVIATGTIRRIAPPDSLKKRLLASDMQEKASAYAESGIWYDALSGISDLIDEHPGDKKLRDLRGSLLHQVGLDDVVREQ